MYRALAAASLALLWTIVATACDVIFGHAIDLNEPGALEALQESNPTHYEKVRKILEGALNQPDAGVRRWMQANFDARDVKYHPILLTSYPPKRRLSFSLDSTRYEAVVTLTTVRRELVPGD